MALRDRLRGILYVKDTPHRIASSFAFGVFWGISPLIGLHTMGAFFTAWLLGLNRFVAVAGSYVTNPVTMVPIFTFSIWLGTKIVGMKQILPEIDWKNATFIYLINEVKHLILPFIVGTFLLSTILAIVSYFVIHHIIVRYKKTRTDYAP